MRTISSNEAKTIYDILVRHEARTLDPNILDPDKVNDMLDNLRGMLHDIGDQQPAGRQLREYP